MDSKRGRYLICRSEKEIPPISTFIDGDVSVEISTALSSQAIFPS